MVSNTSGELRVSPEGPFKRVPTARVNLNDRLGFGGGLSGLGQGCTGRERFGVEAQFNHRERV